MNGHKAGKSLHTSAAIREELCFQGAFIPPQRSQSCKASEGCNTMETLDPIEGTDHQTLKQLPAEKASASTSQSSTSVLRREQGREALAAVLRPLNHLNHHSPNHPFKQPSKWWQDYRDQFFLCSHKKRKLKSSRKISVIMTSGPIGSKRRGGGEREHLKV